MGVLLLILFLLSGVYVFKLILKRKLNIYKILLLILILTAGYLYAYNMRILEEKIHLIKYGILGWLLISDLIKTKHRLYLSIILSLLCCLLVVSIDESIQYFLPWRVGDMRDVWFALIGGLWGILLYITSLAPSGKKI
ncbi:VanZ family protein [Elusimicrobiota bacterium]